jgi:hypothetical protein
MKRLFVAVLILIMPIVAPGDTHDVTPPVIRDNVVWIGIDRFDVPYAVTSRADLLSRDQKGWAIVHRPDFTPPRDATSVAGQVALREAAIRYVNGLVVRPRIRVTGTKIGRSLGPLRGLTKNGRTVALLANATGGSTGAGSYLATSDDGGHSWTRARSSTTAELRAIAVGADDVVYAAGTRGTVLRSTDGGQTWQHVTLEWKAPPADGWPTPAPWFVIWNLFVTLPLLAIAARSLQWDDATIETDSIAESIGSDRPLEKGDPDPMNMRSIALAISRFLRNENTVPPLTISVTGEWGSGKSSLMNLLKADLTDFGFRPVWFNAWHHQKEEHLLASLLHAVRKQAVPRWWRPENFFFRLRLIWIRGWKHRANLLLLILFLSLAIGFASRHNARDSIALITQAVAQKISGKKPQAIPEDLPAAVQYVLLAMATITATIGTAWRGLKAFRMNPAALLASISGSAKVNDLTAEIGFRDKFAGEFSDVTKALGERSLLIFIDDLDRCSPASVGEVLEAVNFLVSSGDCFVVMGMDRARVERYVNVNFAEVVKGEAEFATKYLDKLINIEVPVPEPTDDASTQILVPLHVESPERLSNWRVVRQLAADSLRLWPVALAIVVAVGGFFSGRMTQEPAVPVNSAGTLIAPAPLVPTATTPAASTAPVPSAQRQAAVKTDQPGDVQPGIARKHFWIYWPAVLFLIPLIGVGAWLVTRPSDLVVHDSPLFLDAINIWRPAIVGKLRTPRALKRFMNRLRYLAMRQRPQEEELTLWRQLRLWISGRRQETPTAVTNAIPEPALVALAAMELYGRLEVVVLASKEEEHVVRFGHRPSDWNEAYRRTTAGVRAN